MRILSISLGLAAVAFVAAQADPLAANGPQSTYEWAGDSDLERVLAIQEEAFSELRIRASLLRFNPITEFHAEACEDIVTTVTNALRQAADTLVGFTTPVPGLNFIVTHLKKLLVQVMDIVAGVAGLVSSVSLRLAIGTIHSTLSALSVGPVGFIARPIIVLLAGIEPELKNLFDCQQYNNVGELAINVFGCSSLADLYREALEDSAKISPALNLPADVSEELRRFMIGSLTLLDLMSKTSIAKTNDALLATRPIFAGDLLQEYRAELLRMSPPEDIRNYADISLGSIVSFSNTLEACLRVAADPVGSLDELEEDYEEDEGDEQDYEEDEGDEQDYEEDEEDEQDDQDDQDEQDKQ